MTYRNRTAYLAVAGLCALALAGCTENPEAGRPTGQGSLATSPSTPASSAPAISPTASPTAQKAPERPATARGLTLTAAEAFIRHYVDLMNYASQTGDTDELLAASESGCRRCRAYADFVKKVNESNGGLSGDYREQVKDVSELVRGSGGRLGASAVISIGTYTTKEVSTAPVISKAATYTEEIALSPSGSNWVMYEMKLVKR